MARDLALKSKTCKERYDWYKERGICTTCGVKWVSPGHVRCKECEDRIAWYHNKSKEQRNEAKRKRREERIAAGMCTECGIRRATEGMRMCQRCRDMRNDSTRKYKIQRKIKAKNERIRQALIKANNGGNGNG